MFSTIAFSQTGKDIHVLDWQSAFSKSYEFESKKNYKEAINSLNSIYQDNSYEINLRLGWLCFNAKENKKSIEYYRKAIALKPNSIEARFGYIKPASTLEKWDIVFEQYQEILKIDKQNTYANYWIGMMYYNRSNFSQALKHFETVVNLYPFDADANLMAGWSEFKLGKKDDAKRYFQETLLIYPNNASALEGMSYVK
jgi:tetratricopeptide (TPR) repeat protein